MKRAIGIAAWGIALVPFFMLGVSIYYNVME